MANTVYLVRHGQTYLNLYHRMQGWSDAPLTKLGKQNAADAGVALANLHFDYLFSSDLKRAVDTANIILQHHPQTQIKEPTTDPAFREEFFGFFEGVDDTESAIVVGTSREYDNFRKMIKKYGLPKVQDMIAQSDPFKDAEDSKRFWQRMNPGLDRLRALPDGSVSVVVSHGMAISAIVDRFGNPGDDYSSAPLNGSITKLTLTDQTTHVDFYNQLHIPDN